jgi:hypothetical protein
VGVVYDNSGSILSDWGEDATLVGDGWRKVLTVAFIDRWNNATAAAIGIERIEPVAYVDTDDVTDYDFTNGWTLEVGDDTYRITATAKQQDGLTELTLAKL